MIEQIINVDRMEQAVSLFGSFDENVRLIEQHCGVDIVTRGTDLKVSGEPEKVAGAVRAINGLLQLINRGEQLNEQNVRYVLMLVDENSDDELPRLAADGAVCLTAKGHPVKPKTLGQQKYIEAIRKNTIVLGVGPAGTGKTYLAVAMAVNAFRAKEVNRIILTRPAVEAGEKLGFLPGDLQSKVDPYLRPLYDALFDMLGAETYHKYLERGNIEVAPLAYMRGRTLDDSFIILDGDSTFLHTGVNSLMNMIYNKATGTVMILDNSTTGMTGHQDHAATGKTLLGEPAFAIDIAALCRAMGVKHVIEVDAFDLVTLEKTVKEELARDEVSVIITKSPCILLSKEKKPLYIAHEDKCKKCGMCMKPGCPAMTKNADGTIHIDDTMCTGCGLCADLCKFDAIELVKEGDR